MARSYSELLGMEFEAERLVREGVSRADVSRRLGVHPQTLAGWALRGGWRKKDLDLERSADATRKTILAIRRGNAAVDAQDRLREELRIVMGKAVELLAEGSEEALEQLDRMLGGMRPARRIAAPTVELEPDWQSSGVKSLGDADIEAVGKPVESEWDVAAAGTEAEKE